MNKLILKSLLLVFMGIGFHAVLAQEAQQAQPVDPSVAQQSPVEPNSTPLPPSAPSSTTLPEVTVPDGSSTIIVTPGKTTEPAFLYSASSMATIQVTPTSLEQTIELKIRVLQGKPSVVSIGLNGPGEVKELTGELIDSWSVRSKGGERFLELQLKPDQTDYTATVKLSAAIATIPSEFEVGHLSPGKVLGFDSRIQIDYAGGLVGKVMQAEGFAPLLSDDQKNRFQSSTGGKLVLKVNRQSALPPAVDLINTQLIGTRHSNGKSVSFRLTGTAVVTEANARLRMLSGNAALNKLPDNPAYRIELGKNPGDAAYDMVFPAVGSFPIELEFVAGVTVPNVNWQAIDFSIAASAVVPLTLDGFANDLEFIRDSQAVVPKLAADKWSGFLPATGRVFLQWKNAQASVEGKLFFATNAKIETLIGPGLMKQDHLLTYQVLQGQLKALTIQLLGPGEILDVEGPNLVGWKVVTEGEQRKLEVTLSQSLATDSVIKVRSQTPIGAFPVRVEGLRLLPQGAIRHSGYIRISNAGSVRVDPTGLSGLTQLSPDQFPGNPLEARQLFVYRFPSADYQFSIVADRIQPEVSITEMLVYQITETNRVIQADIELDIREAAIREWDFLLPGDYSIVSVVHPGQDYVAASDVVDGKRNLKVIFGQDVQGRQLVRVRLEKAEPAVAGVWALPRIDFKDAKAVRGDIGIVGAPGFRIVPASVEMLVEKPLSNFPTPIPHLQQAFRIREPNWTASMQVESLDRSVQADVFHLYSLSQGTVYGSALVNYFITGAPTSELQLTVPAVLANVTVDGQDIRTWRRDGEKLSVSLHQPVMGSYTLLVTFEEKPNAADGTFQPGLIAPLDVQGDRGYIEVVSPIQVEVEPVSVSSQLLVLDPLELPAEFRLLSTAPPLGTWQYTERPFDLKLKVKWFEPGTTAAQVVEFAEANSRVSPDGELVTDVVYYVKTRGQRSLRVKLPEDPVRLWAVSVNGQPVTARQTGADTLIPLPSAADPNVPVEVSLRLGKPAVEDAYAELLLPIIDSPVLKTKWSLHSDDNYVLTFEEGTVEPTVPVLWPNGFEWIVNNGLVATIAIVALALFGGLIAVQRGAIRLTAIVFYGIAIFVACSACMQAVQEAGPPKPLQMDLPVLAAGESLSVNVNAIPLWRVQISWTGVGLILGGLAMLVIAWFARKSAMVRFWLTTSFALLAVGALLQANGGAIFFGAIALIGVFAWIIPCLGAFVDLLAAKSKDGEEKPEKPTTGEEKASAVVTSLLFWLCLAGASFLSGTTLFAAAPAWQDPNGLDEIRRAESLSQEWSLASRSGKLDAKGTMTFAGKPGDRFILLRAPAILTRFEGEGLRLSKVEVPNMGLTYIVTIPLTEDVQAANVSKKYTVSFDYQIEAVKPNEGVPVLTGIAALHEIDLRYDAPGWDVQCASAARIEPAQDQTQETRAKILLRASDAVIVLQPQARDLMAEKTQFFIEGTQLYVPGPGVVDGRHLFSVRTSQGKVRDLGVIVPEGLTVSSVNGPVTSWQFDADNRRLMLQIDPAAPANFEIVIETQRGLETLPADVVVAPLRIEGTDGEVGLIAVAFGPDAQPEKVDSATLSPVNLGDFNAALNTNPQVVLHRVYRYGADAGTVDMRVAPVSAEVRVGSQQVLSLGDERIVMNVNFTAEITRTGLFQLSFKLPTGLEVESLSGPSLHHWSEITEDGNRQVILHLNGKTIGAQSFTLVLAGPAPVDVAEWEVPRFELTEASRQTGDLVINPITGVRIRAVTRQNISDLDPRAMGAQSEGALAFRLLQRDWNLVLGIEKLDAWVVGQVLHEVALREGQTKSVVVGDFNIQNASVRSLKVTLPLTNADEIKTVRANGKQISDFVRTAPDSNVWELQFKRRMIGRVQFQIEYERRGERVNDSETLAPLEFTDARQMAYYFAVRAGGRLELEPGAFSEGWQAVDWSVVPAALREAGNRNAPTLAIRSLAATSSMNIRVIRHTLAEALKLRVSDGTLTTVLSPTGDQLTSVDITMEVIQRSSLSVQLPEGGELFSIFVNGESVHSIRQNGTTWQFYILPGIDDRTAQVRFVYLLKGSGLHDLKLASPLLNVPLEAVRWNVIAPKGYKLSDNDGDMELVDEVQRNDLSRDSYLSSVIEKRNSQAQQAAQLLEQAGQFLQAGEQGKAWRAYNNVANRNALDAASNEDARVQLENLQTQQAIVGLNTRRQRMYLDNDFSDTSVEENEQLRNAANMNPILQQNDINFRPQEMSQLLAGNSSKDNAGLQQIAGRLVQHQRSTEPAPQAIVISVPDDGTVYSFVRGVQVAENAPLELELEFSSQYRLWTWQWIVAIAAVALLSFAVMIPMRK
jgi:hypothetical protein